MQRRRRALVPLARRLRCGAAPRERRRSPPSPAPRRAPASPELSAETGRNCRRSEGWGAAPPSLPQHHVMPAERGGDPRTSPGAPRARAKFSEGGRGGSPAPPAPAPSHSALPRPSARRGCSLHHSTAHPIPALLLGHRARAVSPRSLRVPARPSPQVAAGARPRGATGRAGLPRTPRGTHGPGGTEGRRGPAIPSSQPPKREFQRNKTGGKGRGMGRVRAGAAARACLLCGHTAGWAGMGWAGMGQRERRGLGRARGEGRAGAARGADPTSSLLGMQCIASVHRLLPG